MLALRLGPTIRARVLRQLARQRRSWLGLDERDLTQEVWIALLRNGMQKLRQWDPSRGLSLERFVALITARELSSLRWGLRHVHKAARDAVPASELASDESTPESLVLARRSLQSAVARVREALPARALAVFRCIYLEQLGAEQAALALSVRPQVVYNWLHKIRRLLNARD